jgi:PAS domain S-box-containing protein
MRDDGASRLTYPSAGERFRWTASDHRLLDLLPAAVYLCDRDGHIIYFNEQAASLWGRRPELGDADERFCGSFKLFLPDGTPLAHQDTPMAVALQSGAGVRNAEVIIERPDGARLQVRVNIDPILDDDGTIAGAINILTDVTEQRNAERAAAKARDQLASEQSDIRRLHALSSRLSPEADFDTLLHEILQAVCLLMDAPMGCLQLVDEEQGVLRMNAAVGYGTGFEGFFSATRPGQAACGTAWQRRARVVIEDVTTDPIFTEGGLLQVAEEAGFRAVTSVPLFTRTGDVLGTISVTYPSPYRPTGRQLWLLDLYARQAAEVIDVTRRRMEWERAGQEAAEREERLRTAAAAAGFGTYDNDLVSGTRHWSPELCSIVGLSPEALSPAAVGTVPDFIHPDDVERVREMMRHAYDPEGDGSVEHEHRIVRPDGAVRWVLVKGRVQFAGEGEHRRPVHSSGVMIDVTERKQTEAALRESEVKFRSLFEQAAIGMGRVRFDGARWIDVNDAFSSMIGYDRDELLATPWPEITHPDDLDLDLIPFRRMAAGEVDTYTVEKRFIHKQGRHVWARLTLSLVRDARGEPDYEVAIIEDISDRKQAELALRESEERFRATFEQAAVGVAQVGLDGRWLRINDRYCEIVGYEREELLTLTFQDITHPDDVESDVAHVQRLLAGEADSYSMEKRYVRNEGSFVWVNLFASLVRDEDGAPLYFIAAAEDITERKRAVRLLRESEEHARRIIDNALAFVGVLTPDGTLIEANAPALRAGGLAREDVVGRKFWDCDWWNYDPDVQRQLREAVANAVAGEVVRYDVVVRMAGDSRLPIDFMLAPVCNAAGQVTYLIPSAVDIADRKRSEEAIKQSEERFRTMGEVLPYGVWWCNEHGQIEYVSQSFLDLLEMTMDEVREFGWTKRLVPEELEPMLTRWFHCLETGEPWEGEHHLLGPDGRYHGVLSRGRAVRDSADKIVGWAGINLDIDDRKRAERELAETRERLEIALSAGDVATWVWEVQHDRVHADRNLANFFAVSHAETDGRSFADYLGSVHPDDRQRVAEAIQSAIDGSQEEYEAEYRVTGADGVTRSVVARGVIERDAEGQAVRMPGVVVDVTERRETERTAQESEARLRFALESCNIGAWDMELEGDRTAHHSLEHDRIFGYSELQPKWTLEDFLRHTLPEYREPVEELVQKATAARTGWTYECPIRRVDGEIRWIWFSGRFLVDASGCERVAGVVQDITDRKQAELALQRSHAQSQALFNQMTEGLVLFDPGGNLLDMNPAALAIHGFDSADSLRRHLDTLTDTFELSDVDGSALPTSRWPIGRVLRGETFSRYEVRCRRPDTGKTWIGSYGGTPIYGPDGRMMLAIVTLRDVTSERAAEEALAATRAAAEAANVAKSQFLANMSHELRTPMNAILGMTDLALREDLSPALADYLQTVKDSGESLLELLNTLLDFSRIEAGQMELDRCPFQLREAVTLVAKTLGVRAAEKDLELICDIQDDVPDGVIGDPLRLRQVLMNLVGNAIKFTDDGEVVISAAVQSWGEDHVRLRFGVRDTGPGIAAADHERIFSPFAQADASTTRRHGGSGLGLAIVRNLVDLMDGEVRLQSEVGRGSTFTFTVDLGLQSVPDPPRSADPLEREAIEGLPVLIVADNATSRRMLERTVSAWGMEPAVVRNVPGALARVHQAAAHGRSFRLVLADADLPEIDGFSLAEWVGKDPSLAGPVILMLSATERSAQAERCRAAGAACIEKPISQSKLFDTIIRSLGLEGTARRQDNEPERRPPSRTLRILLAEDTPANQKLATYLLTGRGHSVEVADNGQQAVERLQQGSFDVVLMDVQMPVMDGLKATAAIRKLDDAAKARIPIIALTAHALRGDAERCIAAGMDDYTSKPIDADKLIELVERMGDRNELPDPSAAVPSGAIEACGNSVSSEAATGCEEGATIAAERPVFDHQEAVRRCYGSEEMFQKIVACYFEEADAAVTQLFGALENQDAETLGRVAHRLKNTLVYLGAAPATAAAEQLEVLGRSGKLNQASAAYERLRNELERLRAALVSYRNRDG